MNEETLFKLVEQINRISETLYGTKPRIETITVSDDKNSVTFALAIDDKEKQMIFDLTDSNALTYLGE